MELFSGSLYSDGLFEENTSQQNELNSLSQAERNAVLGFTRTSRGIEVRTNTGTLSSVPFAGTADGEFYQGNSTSLPIDGKWVAIDSTDVYNLRHLGVNI